MFKSFVQYLVDRPPLSHAIEAIGFFLVLLAFHVSVPMAAVILVTLYYARESGQLEHDLRAQGIASFPAWTGAAFLYRWRRDNWQQWLVPAFTIIVLALAIVLAQEAALPKNWS